MFARLTTATTRGTRGRTIMMSSSSFSNVARHMITTARVRINMLKQHEQSLSSHVASSLHRTRRSFLSRVNDMRLARLEEAANASKDNPARQVEFYKELLKEEPELVIRRVESGEFATDASVYREYVKALVMTGKIDQRSATELAAASRTYGGASGSQQAGMMGGSNATAAVMGGMGGAGLLGLESRPMHVVMQEPGFKSQIWRTIRTLVVAFFVLTGMNALLSKVSDGRLGGALGTPTEIKAQESDCKFSFKDVEGVDEAKAELREIVSYLRDPDQFSRLGGKLPKGVMMMGPPGTGKTLLARAIAGEADVPFFYCSGSEFDEMYVGVGARRMRDLFAAAKQRAPCIIFIDEIDAIGGSRNPMDQKFMRMTLNQLLVELDGFNTSDGVIVIGATNFPESLDKALIRPGRFDLHVQVPLPDIRGREKILQVHSRNVSVQENIDMRQIARGTPGFSGADLMNVINQAALKASVDKRNQVTLADLEYAKDKIMMGVERKSAVIPDATRKLTAFHEGGHALVALETPGAMPIHKATIMPRGRALGMVMQLPEDDRLSITKQQMLARIDVSMGGRVAEEIIFGADKITSGASNDIEQATKLARAMVMQYGMSAKVGPVQYDDKDLDKLSTETRALIENEVKEILTSSYARVVALLKKNEKKLHRLAQSLLEHETLTATDLKLVVQGKPPVLDSSIPVDP